MEMLIPIIVFMAIGLICTIVAIFHAAKDNADGAASCCFCSIFFTAMALLMCICAYCTTPSAMDVYQGRTTLQITYQDSIAIDSVVVFKK